MSLPTTRRSTLAPDGQDAGRLPAATDDRVAGLGGPRRWLALLGHAVGLSVLIGLSLLLLVAAMARAAHAQPAATGQANQPTRAAAADGAVHTDSSAIPPTGAALVFRTEQGLVAAPLQSSRVKIRIAGNAVRARIVQRFRNPGERWLDAVYQFPLPDDAAVDTLDLRIGERIIEGVIREKSQARREFTAASEAGKRAAMVSQQRPNVFTADVANIGPGAEVEIALEYQQALGLEDDGWTLRLPTVVAPRYEGGTSAMPQPPTLLDDDPRANRLSLDVTLVPGLPIEPPRSPSHRLEVSSRALPSDGGGDMARAWDIGLTGEALADRDFVLRWRPTAGAEPAAAMQVEAHDGRWYGLLSVAPPAPAGHATAQPRELVFVIDHSGSMHGESIAQARTALRFGLRRLHPDDRFNIVAFNDRHEALFPESRPADAVNLHAAEAFIDRLEATGGTEMSGALERALLPPVPAGLLSQVVFVTDGAVDNEAAMFTLVDNLLGQRRLYTVGIGSSPNSYFMRQAATSGRGTFTMIDAAHAVESTMARLFRRLGEPVLTDLRLRDGRGEILRTRDPIRDLHAGDPILVALQLPEEPVALTLEGEHDGRPWQRALTLVRADAVGVHKLWARSELDRLGAAIRRAGGDDERRGELRAQATDIALSHSLVSPYTSLVAVDRTPVRPVDETSTRAEVPRHLPAGWNAAAVFGASAATMPLASTATGAWSEILAGLALLVLAAAFLAAFLCRAQDLFERR
jgi:Ca-activated chloride channel family protein